MTTLKNQIENAKTSQELEMVINSIEKQENGNKTQIARHLDDAFWYVELNDVSKQKNWMIKILNFYIKAKQENN